MVLDVVPIVFQTSAPRAESRFWSTGGCYILDCFRVGDRGCSKFHPCCHWKQVCLDPLEILKFSSSHSEISEGVGVPKYATAEEHGQGPFPSGFLQSGPRLHQPWSDTGDCDACRWCWHQVLLGLHLLEEDWGHLCVERCLVWRCLKVLVGHGEQTESRKLTDMIGHVR